VQIWPTILIAQCPEGESGGTEISNWLTFLMTLLTNIYA
jgi:hypothetical protein